MATWEVETHMSLLKEAVSNQPRTIVVFPKFSPVLLGLSFFPSLPSSLSPLKLILKPILHGLSHIILPIAQ